MDNVLLTVDNLQKKFHKNIIIDHLSFSLLKGENLIIYGKSGCGKTTLLRCIALLEKIDEGKICFDGETVSKKDYIKPIYDFKNLEISMVFQNLYLWNHLTVLENVAMPLRLRTKCSRKLANQAALKKLIDLEIGHKAEDYPTQLSGGQRQRAALARAIVHSPSILLLDEITANLDLETAEKVIQLVEQIAYSKETSVILTSHARLTSSVWSQALIHDGTRWIKKDNYNHNF